MTPQQVALLPKEVFIVIEGLLHHTNPPPLPRKLDLNENKSVVRAALVAVASILNKPLPNYVKLWPQTVAGHKKEGEDFQRRSLTLSRHKRGREDSQRGSPTPKVSTTSDISHVKPVSQSGDVNLQTDSQRGSPAPKVMRTCGISPIKPVSQSGDVNPQKPVSQSRCKLTDYHCVETISETSLSTCFPQYRWL